jgi:hypothetical protein
MRIFTSIILLLATSFLYASKPDVSKYPKELQLNAGYYNLGSVDEIYSNNLYSGSDICYGVIIYLWEKAGASNIFYAIFDDRSPSCFTETNR